MTRRSIPFDIQHQPPKPVRDKVGKRKPTPEALLTPAERREKEIQEARERREAVKQHAIIARIPRKSAFVQKPAGRSGPVHGKRRSSGMG
jgi:hypothetical protein